MLSWVRVGIYAFLYLFCTGGYSQYWEIGPALGTSYYLGDINPQRHFNHLTMPPSMGLILKKTLNKRYALKFSGTYNTMQAEDLQSAYSFNQYRLAGFTNKTYEGSLHLEFNFYPYQIGTKENFTFYAFTGASVYYYDTRVFWKAGINDFRYIPDLNNQSQISIAWPFGAGFKLGIRSHIGISLEWGMRKLFQDNFDGLSYLFANSRVAASNQSNNDWYNVSLLILTYRFGKKAERCPSTF